MGLLTTIVNLGANTVRGVANVAGDIVNKATEAASNAAGTADGLIDEAVTKVPAAASKALTDGFKTIKKVGGETWDNLKEVLPEMPKSKEAPAKEAPKPEIESDKPPTDY